MVSIKTDISLENILIKRCGMSKTPLTKEQKEWYLIGYFEATAQSLANDLNISKDEARNSIIIELENRKKQQMKCDF
jgi:hypothetical protein